MPGGKSKPLGGNQDMGEEAMGKLKLGPQPLLSIWVDGAAKDNHIAGVGRVGGVGVVFGNSSLPHLYGPVEFNMTEKVTNNAAELQAAILGLEQAKANNFKNVEMNTNSKFLENIMTKWMDQWKENNWKKFDGKQLQISIDLLKKLDKLRSAMDITWRWLPMNSCPELVLADDLANLGCRKTIQAQENELNNIFRRTVYDRRMIYPDELPPTVLRSKDQVLIPPGEIININCTLDISERLKQKLIENKRDIRNVSSDQAYGWLTTMRNSDPMEEDGTVMARCHTMGSEFHNIRPTLVLPRGSVVGLAFYGFYAKDDDLADKMLTGLLFWISRKDVPLLSTN